MPVEPRWRMAAGMALILAWIAAWSVAVVTVAGWIERPPVPLLLLYLLIAGIVWILPLKPLLRWMSK